MLVVQLCLTVYNSMDCSPPGSSVHIILQARILKWVAILFSRGSSQSRDQTCIIQQWPHNWKRSVFIPIPKKDNIKEWSNYCRIALILHTSKVMLKILQARLQQYVNCELPDVQAVFRKGKGTRDQIGNIRWIIKKAREFQKKYQLLLYWLCQSLWLWGSPQTVEKS